MSAVQIDTIELSDYLQLPGLKNMVLRAGSVRYLAGGGIVDQSIAIGAGQMLTLAAVRDGNGIRGYFTGAQIDAINALRATGATVPFVHHLGSWQVRVDSVDVEPVWRYKTDPTATDKYVGTVVMIIK